MNITEKYWDIRDEDALWRRFYFDKVPSANPRREIGNRLEVATELGLIKAGIDFIDTTRVAQSGKVPDFITKTMTIECKNTLGAINGSYKLDINKYRVSIRERFDLSDSTIKVLILPEGTDWTYNALYRARRDRIQIVYVQPVRTYDDIIPASNQIAEVLSSYVV